MFTGRKKDYCDRITIISYNKTDNWNSQWAFKPWNYLGIVPDSRGRGSPCEAPFFWVAKESFELI